ncbi:hydroxymethylbilane synthase [Carboxylicivirga sediminis]|uniref:Porphobilinogen deaminase n=1 Tax=Carboxylicivirga sediminis TaxID=2006564 RepID=A0A941IYR7_9BACT|nr:hydroxymethylbilane synthase [Carboxylicivirga sediminis]MBR8538171.1 hydroxymethylbilane synthase [Carboxylicivirga sediminis]
MSKSIVRIGTRGSQLALYQANLVKSKLEQAIPDTTFEIVIISTKGDKILDVALSKIGDKGLFTKELEHALFNNEVDMCVHSLKDLPTVFPEGAQLGAILKRAEYKDAWVSKDGLSLEEMTEAHTVATSSLRRKAQVHRINPKVKVVDIRGNVNTRLKKMEDGHCDAMVMAGAGLIRLGFDDVITNLFEPDYFVSACGQGAIAVEIRDNDAHIEAIVKTLHCEESYQQITAERSFLNELEGGCQIPIGAYANIDGDDMHLLGLVAMPDGSQELRAELSGKACDAETIGRKLAQQMAQSGAHEILEKVRTLNNQ